MWNDWSLMKKLIWLRGSGAGGSAPIYETVTGAIVSFITKRIAPLKIEASLEPIQGLHGYDNPWPGGGGINKLSPASAETKSHNSVQVVSDGNGKYTISGTATGGSASVSFALPTQYVIASGDYLHIMNSAANGSVVLQLKFSDNTSFAPSMTPINRIISMADHVGKTLVNLIVYVTNGVEFNAVLTPMIVASSSATSFAPYSNICPITGHTGAVVEVNDSNLLNDDDPVVLNAYYSSSTINANVNNRIVVVPCKSSTKYTFTWNRVAISGTQDARVCSFTESPDIGSSGTIMAATVSANSSATFTTGANDTYLGIYFGDARYTDFSASLSASTLNLGETALPHEAYSNNTVTLTFGSTVYGGKLTVNEDGSGSVVAEYGLQDLGAIPQNSWRYNFASSGAFDTAYLASAVKRNSCICSNYKRLDSPTGSAISADDYFVAFNKKDDGTAYTGNFAAGTLIVKDSNYSDIAAFVSAMSGVQLVYELATPVTIALTPGQVNALLGNNTVWLETGDDDQIVSVTYQSN